MDKKVVNKRIDKETKVPSLIGSENYEFVGESRISAPTRSDLSTEGVLQKKREKTEIATITLKFELNKDSIQHTSWTQQQISKDIANNPSVLGKIRERTIKNTDSKKVVVIQFAVKECWFESPA